MAATPGPSGLAENLPSEGRVSILLVDDRPANLVALEASLDDLGHDLVKARSGEEALQRLPDYDPARHFGGVRYLFVRAVRPAWVAPDGGAMGVFAHRPTLVTLQRLSDLLDGVRETA